MGVGIGTGGGMVQGLSGWKVLAAWWQHVLPSVVLDTGGCKSAFSANPGGAAWWEPVGA